nr:hypothetical protein B0A51_00693 [Rachicladosporium sp. CCFEE 5018]
MKSVLGWACFLGTGLVSAYHSPRSTVVPLEQADSLEWAPEPTSPPDLLRRDIAKRDNRPASICGYLDGVSDYAWDCGSTGICGFGNNAFGCCANATVVAGSTQLAQCEQISSCRNYSQGCDDACVSDSGLAYCGNSTFPYCGAVLASGVYTNFECYTAPQGTPHTVLATWTADTSPTSALSSSSLLGSAATLTTTSMSDLSTTTESSSASTIIQTSIPFTQSQPAESSAPSAAATVTVTASRASTILSHSGVALWGIVSILLHAHRVADFV